jgi:hypothetical protein
MQYSQIGSKVIVRIDKGEEIVLTLRELCQRLHIKAGTIMGIGATDRATIGLFNVQKKQYHSTTLTGDHEIIPIYGNISTLEGKVYLHLHATLCDSKHNSYGGHLNDAVVSATFEAVIDCFEGEIRRSFDKDSGLNLFHLK